MPHSGITAYRKFATHRTASIMAFSVRQKVGDADARACGKQLKPRTLSAPRRVGGIAVRTVRFVALRCVTRGFQFSLFRKDPWRKSRNAPHRTAIYAADSSRLQDRSSGVQCNSEFTRRKSQGLKNPFCVQEDELLWAADELLTEEGQTHPVVLSHNYLNVTRLRAVADPWEAVGAIAPPEWSLKSFFGNQFSQYVVIFLFQGLQEILPQLQIYHPGLLMCLCIAQFAAFALTNQPTMTLIAYLYLYTMWGGSYKHYVGLIWRYGHMMSGGPTPKRLLQSILKFSRSTPAG